MAAEEACFVSDEPTCQRVLTATVETSLCISVSVVPAFIKGGIMKKLILGLVALSVATPALAQSVYVKPHVRSDGTYVQGHYRSAPDSSPYNNWTTRPNVNPYTGQQGTREPYSTPTYRAPSYTPTYRAPSYSPPCYYNCGD